jgi:hypothetical protein
MIFRTYLTDLSNSISLLRMIMTIKNRMINLVNRTGLILSLFIAIIQHPAYAQPDGSRAQGNIHPLNTSAAELERLLKLSREIYARPLSRQILKTAFAPHLIEGQKEITEPQLIRFLSENDLVVESVDGYLKKVAVLEKQHLVKVKALMKKFEKELNIDVDRLNEQRMMIRSMRGQVPTAAIKKFMKAAGVAEDAIEAFLAELTALNEELKTAWTPIETEYTQQFAAFLQNEEVIQDFKKYSDPSIPFEVKIKGKSDLISVEKAIANFDYQDSSGQWVPKGDLEEDIYLDMIRKAQKNYIAAIYETDLKQYGIELAARTDIDRMHIADAGVLLNDLAAKEIFDLLQKSGVNTVAAISVALMHLKTVATGVGVAGCGRVALLSANGTYSCSARKGDWLGPDPVPPQFISNANIGLIFLGDLFAALIKHELLKTGEKQSKGEKDFAIGGIYRFRTKDQGVLDFAMTPNGANNSIMNNMIIPLIQNSNAPYFGGSFFANAAVEMNQAIFDLYQRVKKNTGKALEADIIFDKGFSLAPWSLSLMLTGQKVTGTKAEGNRTLVDDPESIWIKNLTAEELASWRKNIRLAPRKFQNGRVTVGDQQYEYSVKNHLKLFVVGDRNDVNALKVNLASYNPGKAAEKNHEFNAQTTSIKEVSELALGVIRQQAKESEESVYDYGQRKIKDGTYKDIDYPEPTEVESRRLRKDREDLSVESAKAYSQANKALICVEKLRGRLR